MYRLLLKNNLLAALEPALAVIKPALAVIKPALAVIKPALAVIKCAVLVLLLSSISNISLVHAQETGLCPPGYSEGVVSTGFVDCVDTSSATSQREDAEADRIQIEAVCILTPNAEVTNSQILTTSSGRFFASVTCTISRPIPPGTALCSDDSEEVFRAFDTLVCQYFGKAVATVAAGQAALAEQATDCTGPLSGQVLGSGLREGNVNDIPFYFTSLSCGINIPATNVIECPFTFNQNRRTQDLLECSIFDETFETLEEAQEANGTAQSLCTDTTAGLGVVTEFAVGATSNSKFISSVDCDIVIPRLSEFSDDSIVRACDASCTEDIQQSRTCLNGGVLGGPGCVGPATQVITQKCNTGTNSSGLCPLQITAPAILAPILLLDDEEQ